VRCLFTKGILYKSKNKNITSVKVRFVRVCFVVHRVALIHSWVLLEPFCFPLMAICSLFVDQNNSVPLQVLSASLPHRLLVF
jgi:hypothetical protein